ncbi:hybrid sensory histidine kinase [Hyphomonas adhaerens MHS-3]|uniref:histidine kinase n=1 Tax=Hyphomonas adhaerens MHS-3 TaxID=1280949 RepID=A0A069E8W2_9PROT|nr:response regulator [Hyphomonas adhaerens]KCZ84826.1 hybrid sensory histidine kinase [Hyphomonas adhaerens MHS-3]
MNGDGKTELLKGVLNLLPNPVFIKNSDHVWIEVNDALCRFGGRPRESLIGHTDYDFFPKDQADLFREVDNGVLETRAGSVNTVQFTNADGEVRWVESSKSCFEDAAGNVFIVGVLTDVTERILRETALEEARETALNAAKSKTEFLANMSHEIRTPMNGVLGMSQVLRRTALNEEQVEIVDMIERSGEALLTVINDILDFSKIEAGKLTIDAEPFSLSTVLDDVAALLGSGANEKGIELITDISRDVPDELVGDAGRIRQILTNLVGNAIKFTTEGHILVRITGSGENGYAHLAITVDDTGIGIPEDKLETVFHQFEQADASTTRRFGGTGLGLSICRSLVEAMAGQIDVTSTFGVGSTFRVELTLPIADDEPRLFLEPVERADLSHVRALVIDDISLNCRISASQLALYGIRSDHETDPRQGLRRLAEAHNRREPYDLLVLDYQMPDIDGLRVARMIRSKPAFNRLKIVVVSSVDSQDVKAAFLKAGVNDFLIKPLLSGALGKAVSGVIGSTRRPAPVTAPKPVPPVAPAPPPGGRILIAEDNEVNQRVIAGLLEGAGYELHFAANGKIAVDLFRQNAYALVLMDVSMPVMDGMAATRVIRDFEATGGRPPTPVIAVTAHAMTEERREFLSRGADAVLTKPLDKAELLETVRTWTGRTARQVA